MDSSHRLPVPPALLYSLIKDLPWDGKADRGLLIQSLNTTQHISDLAIITLPFMFLFSPPNCLPGLPPPSPEQFSFDQFHHSVTKLQHRDA